MAPDIDGMKFGVANPRLVSRSEEAEKFAQKAKAIGELCRSAPGKKGAVAKILELIEGENCEA